MVSLNIDGNVHKIDVPIRRSSGSLAFTRLTDLLTL